MFLQFAGYINACGFIDGLVKKKGGGGIPADKPRVAVMTFPIHQAYNAKLPIIFKELEHPKNFFLAFWMPRKHSTYYVIMVASATISQRVDNQSAGE